MANCEELNILIENIDHQILFDNALKINELLEDDILLDDIMSENLFVYSFELLDMIKSDPESYKISDINNDEKINAISSIIRKMELSFIEF
ncbi:hypothetical protein OFR22_06790 [Brachyspira hyodysenteriae]|uniref:Uncharacterized protein n=2 Tax=Brachyspira hyodysenteriae TaxID=159 RepID=A0A3B6VBN1_BRAHW|nr:hypothetical protein [Brachyspira hyodysenteriae]ACN84027.1 hypothetical protein BHWA1_01557 [Brachyspira hyodysenteriae WA1]ANN63866.1 hypothetical protein BHYOB78_08295 [Brachyspira hyodysenteriae ATCC 27164]AUJ49756.1 hypothetical protein BH718_01315 [Brachyspira hyodysenteriae]KLI16298.1 hypothetical protein SU45_07830 [Brachyspira hyodysenteriae]KLI18056.1 hypothetical protein SU46_08385 [Brachyspira hyodysenteriae]